MRRLRHRIAKSEIDRKVGARLLEAEKALIAAVRDCELHLSNVKRGTEQVEVSRTRRVIGDLTRALRALSSVGSVRSLYGDEDVVESPAPKRPGSEGSPN